MRPFIIFEMFIIVVFLYLIINLIRYLFFRTGKGGIGFELSDQWIEQELKQKKKKNGTT